MESGYRAFLPSSNVKVSPFLRWAGSKRKLLPFLSGFWEPEYRRYVEPFAGCAALFFAIQPPRAILGDINRDLMDTFAVVRAKPDALHAALSALPAGETHYYQIRSQSTSKLSKFRQAVRFVYLNRHCFNGIYRTNTEGKFNVPFGGEKPGIIPPIETFRKCARLLERAVLYTGDFGRILSATGRGDFVYIDPPYAVESRRVFRQYGPREFAKKDLRRLGEHLKSMDSRGARFVVSYADCAEAREALERWNPRRVRVRRNVAGFGDSRRAAYELVGTNIERGGT
jgi:DNA adenine methylase